MFVMYVMVIDPPVQVVQIVMQKTMTRNGHMMMDPVILNLLKLNLMSLR